MTQHKTRKRILTTVLALLLVSALVVTVIYLSDPGSEGRVEWASVAYGTLYSNISATGVVYEMSRGSEVPLAAYVYGIENMEEVSERGYEVNWATILFSEQPQPIAYRVSAVNESLSERAMSYRTDLPAIELVTLVPVYFDFAALVAAYEAQQAAGETEAETLLAFIFTVLLNEQTGNIEHEHIPSEFLREDDEAAFTVTTNYPKTLLEQAVPLAGGQAYQLSKLTYREGDMLTLGSTLFSLSFRYLTTLFTISEYDYADINARMNQGETVYAAVAVNALGGRKLIAEVLSVQKTENMSGVSYYTLQAGLVFANLEGLSEENPYGDFTYYDPSLDQDAVRALGVGLKDNLTQQELVHNYSITLTIQKSVIRNTLIVPTKCIFYDDNKRPYLLLQGEDNKEKRVFINITLSTGKDAAVQPLEGYQLEEGDLAKYIENRSLISSLF
ncbi:MAG: hypothetical protein WDA00_02475 [Eubacteriales bacterium]